MTTEINHNFTTAVTKTDSLSQLNHDNRELILEHVNDPVRKTSFVYLPEGETLTPNTGIEVLVLEGSCQHNKSVYAEHHYLRIPGSSLLSGGIGGCKLFIKFNQFMDGDKGERVINIKDSSKWLPGPADGIRIRPLHVFNTESIMLLHWQRADEFRPNLDPQGEELLVLSGLLQNRDHLFKPYSWIRNPVEDWRSWHGSTDTLVYYKSGHFPADLSAQTPEKGDDQK